MAESQDGTLGVETTTLLGATRAVTALGAAAKAEALGETNGSRLENRFN